MIEDTINNELRPNITKNSNDIATVNTNLVSAIGNINNAIKTVNDNLVDAVNTINGGIATEIQERKDADVAEKEARIATDEEIKATILTEEGTSFDTNSGVLTLKSKGGTNDIKVQFSMNFGEF